ncbi:hypothetical protein MFIFM68171_03431 [Madurella fahalii]|uniref:Uncharacterized protein n=1 Tax=Madurella fahalii TaxID=1157608 RepID=A0ABQ0G615_9PEZI
MGLCVFVRVVLFGASVRALAFPGPSPTDDIYAIQEDGWTPMPTAPPDVHEVLRRQNNLGATYIMAPDNTCGFVSGRSSAAYTCVGSKLRCAFIPSSRKVPGAAGCCDGTDCAFRVSCIDSADMKKSCDKDCQADSLTLKCTGSAKFCNTVAFPLGVTDYYCATRRIARVQSAQTTYRGQKSRTMVSTVIKPTASSSTRSSTSRRSTKASSSLTSTTSSSDTVSPDTASSTTATSTTSDSARANAATSSSTDLVAAPAPAPATPAGAIVGGVLGGVALLTLIIFGAVFLRQRQQRHLQALQADAPSGQNQHPMSEPPFQPQPPAAHFAQSSPYSSQTPPSPAQSHQFAAQTYGAAAAAAVASSAAGKTSSSFGGPLTSNYADYHPSPMSTPSPQPIPPVYHTYQQQQQQQQHQYQQQSQDQPWIVTPPDRADTSTPQSVRNASPVTPASALSSQPADHPSNSGGNGAGVVPLILQPGMGSWQQRYRTESLSSTSSPSIVNGRPIIPYSPAVREQQQAQKQMAGEGVQAAKQNPPQELEGGSPTMTTATTTTTTTKKMQGEPAELP